MTDATAASPAIPTGAVAVDDHRRSSFLGLTLARMGSRPYSIVMGTYLALLMAERTTSAIAITVGLTAHKYVSAVVFPVAGRLSDRTTAKFGRRVPYMAGGLATTAFAVFLFSVVHGYWPLVAVIVLARTASVFNLIGRVAATPDIFGRSRWILAVISVAVAGLLPGLLTLLVIRSTWDQDDPSTWNTTFRIAALGLAIAAVAVATLVRESPASRKAAEIAATRSWREEVRSFLDLPNARVAIVGAACLAAAGAAVSRLLPVWANQVVGIGGRELADSSVFTPVGSIMLVPPGLWLAGKVHPRTLAVVATTFGAVVTSLHVFVSSLPIFILSAIVTVPLSVAAIAAGVPLLLRLIPRADNLGETVGFLAGPVGVLTTAVSVATAGIVDIAGTYRVMWLVSGAFTFVAAIAFTRLVVPEGMERTNLRALVRDARRANESSGSVVDRLFGGTVREADVLEGDVLGRQS